MSGQKELEDEFFTFIAMSDYIDTNGTLKSKGQPMSLRWHMLCNDLANIALKSKTRIIIEEIK